MSLASSTIPILEPLSYSTAIVEEDRPVQKPSRLGSRAPIKLPRSTMIGDLKLTALKGKLSTKGVRTEFAGEGVLLCRSNKDDDNDLSTGSIVAVRKKADGRVELEGSVTEVYYTVRQTIRELHALVAA